MKRTLVYIGLILAAVIGSLALYQPTVMAQVDGFFNAISVSSGGTLNGTFGGTATFTNALIASITGNAATATSLAATPVQCSGSTPLATGIKANGDANCSSAGVPLTQMITLSPGCNAATGTSYSACNDTLTWPTPFADATYVPVCFGEQPAANGGDSSTNVGITLTASSWTASQITVITQDTRSSSDPARYSEIMCIAVHN